VPALLNVAPPLMTKLCEVPSQVNEPLLLSVRAFSVSGPVGALASTTAVLAMVVAPVPVIEPFSHSIELLTVSVPVPVIWPPPVSSSFSTVTLASRLKIALAPSTVRIEGPVKTGEVTTEKLELSMMTRLVPDGP
jgi:hypothetical protein